MIKTKKSFTFKKQPKLTGRGYPWQSVAIKYNKKEVGLIGAPSWRSQLWVIRVAVCQNKTIEDPCPWKWVIAQCCNTEEEARKWVQNHADELLSMCPINTTLLLATLKRIEDNPSQWDQADYRCKTGMCFAGHACELAGGEWAFPLGCCDVPLDALIYEDGDGRPEYSWGETKVKFCYARDRARRLLGLTEEQSVLLFAGGNTMHDLRRIVGQLVRGETVEGRYAVPFSMPGQSAVVWAFGGGDGD